MRCGAVQVLNQTSVWWFDNTKHITDNAIVSAPDPNVTIAKKCTVFPVEFVGNSLFSFFASSFAHVTTYIKEYLEPRFSKV